MWSLQEVMDLLSPASQEAVRALVRQLCENEGIAFPSLAAPGLQTLHDGVDSWSNYLISQGYSPRTLKLYLSCVNAFLRSDASPTALEIQHYLATLRRSGMSSAGVKNQLKALKSFFRFLNAHGLWPGDPTRIIKSPRGSRKEVTAPSHDQVIAVLAAIPVPKLRVAVILASDSGLRWSEMTTLTWDRVNFQDRELRVIGKGDKERTIPLSPIACMALGWLRDLNGDKGNLVFPSTSAKGWDNRNANVSLARYCTKASVPKFTWHQLRHFFATSTLQNGADLKTVSEILGHTDPATTVRYYAHTDRHRMRSEHDTHAPFAHFGQQLMLPPTVNGEHEDTEGNSE